MMRSTFRRSWFVWGLAVLFALGGAVLLGSAPAAGGDVAEAEAALTRILEHPELAPLRTLTVRRLELDRRRHDALKAIFNLRRYVRRGSATLATVKLVQAEVDRRVDCVLEIWGDVTEARVSPDGETVVLLEEWLKGLSVLEAQGGDVGALRRHAGAAPPFIRGTPFTIRTLWLDAGERDRFPKDRHVCQVTNARVEQVTEHERAAVKALNDYRAAIGFTARVVDVSKDEGTLTEDNVGDRFDAARLEGITPLRPLRLDVSLAKAARAHTRDMVRRGFFSHHAPPDPERGWGRTSPKDRVRMAGYAGTVAEEVLAMGATEPRFLLFSWRHDPPSHRIILSPHRDVGLGKSKYVWTANLGTP